MRCRPLTVTGPVPALRRMVTGAFSSNSPRLTWGQEVTTSPHWSLLVRHTWPGWQRTIGRQLMWRLAMGTEMVFPWWFMAVTSTTLFSSLAPSPRQTCNDPSRATRFIRDVRSSTRSPAGGSSCARAYVPSWARGSAPAPPRRPLGKCRRALWKTARRLEPATSQHYIWSNTRPQLTAEKTWCLCWAVGTSQEKPTCAPGERSC